MHAVLMFLISLVDFNSSGDGEADDRTSRLSALQRHHCYLMEM